MGQVGRPALPEVLRVLGDPDQPADRVSRCLHALRAVGYRDSEVSDALDTCLRRGLSRDAEYVLTRVPKVYESDNPAAEYLKLKSFVTMIPVKDAELNSKDLSKKVLAAFEALQPLLEFINQSIEG